jgi:polar amino acid transport system substrate-binding protein
MTKTMSDCAEHPAGRWAVLCPVIACLWLLAIIAAAPAAALVFVTEDLPPLNFPDGKGGVAGPSRAIIGEVCRRVEVSCSFDLLPWRRALKDAQDGRLNGLFSIGRDPEREDWMYFSLPLLRARHSFFVNSETEVAYGGPATLEGFTIATYGPSNLSTSLQSMIGGIRSARMEVEVDYETTLNKLSRLRYGPKGAVYFNQAVVDYVVARDRIPNIVPLAVESTVAYYIGWPKNGTARTMVERFDRALAEMFRDGATGRYLAPFGLDLPSPGQMGLGEHRE